MEKIVYLINNKNQNPHIEAGFSLKKQEKYDIIIKICLVAKQKLIIIFQIFKEEKND